ncbi:MAG TPA: O-antigen ligase family protein [Ktedonobacteraceae bacterium]|nr:O-antigen ligase family protein [Ktedonobacteraceae bacterium]
MANMKVENVVQMPKRWEIIRERISPSLIVSILALLASLSIGVVVGKFSPIYGAAAAGAIVIVIIVLLRLDELTATLIFAIHIWVDTYRGLHVIAMLLALALLFFYYFGRSTNHPWTKPRSIWLWFLFLILTIYPTIHGASFNVNDAYGFYLHLVLGAFFMFWLGNLVAKDIPSVRRLFQLLSVLATLIAIHTILEAITGKFLFASARIEAELVQYSNFQIVEVDVSRAGSFFVGPDGDAAFLATCFFFPLGLFVESKRFWAKVIYLLAMLLILLALIFTYSTGGWIGTLAAIVIFVFLTGRIRNSLLTLIEIVILTAMLFAVFPSQIAAQLYHASSGNTLLLHLGSWQTAIRVIEAFPLFGVGMGRAYLVSADPYRVPAQFVPLAEPDNSYLQWGAIAGIPVMLIFLSLIACVFWFAWRNWRAVDTRYRPLLGGGIAALIALSVISLSVNGWTSPNDLVYLDWLIAGIISSPLIRRSLCRQSTPPADGTTMIFRADNAKQIREAELPTQTGAPADFVPSPLSLPVLDGLFLDDQPTPILPANSQQAGNQASLLKEEDHSQNGATGNGQVSPGTQGYLSLAFEMVKSSGIYALGALASPLISLVLAPFLTHQLSSSDYGGLAVLYTIIDLVTAITQLGLGLAFFRAYNGDYESSRDRSGILSASIILLSLVSIPLAIAIMMAAPWLSELLFNSQSFTGAVRLTALVIIMENLTVPGLSWLRAEKHAVLFSVLSITNLLLVLSTNIVLVGVLHIGVNGALIAKGAGYAVIVVCTLPIMFLFIARQRSLWLRSDIVRNMLVFGVPTIFGDMAAWVLQLSDRYLLSHFGSLAQTAIYTVSYTLGGVLSPVVLSPFGLAWTPVMYSIAKRKDAEHIFRLVFRWFNAVLLFATFALSLLSTVFLELLFPPVYHAGELIIPFIALSTMGIGIYYIFMTGVYIRRRTILESVFMLVAAAVNVLLNICLIPYFGAMGAAVSTLLAYTVLASVSYIVNQRIYPVDFEIGSFIMKLFIGIVLYVASTLLAHNQQPWIRWSVSICALILYGIVLMLLAGLSVKKLIKIVWYVREALGKGGDKTYA